MTPPTILWYFADPMCSWCWGFTPVFEKIQAAYSDRINLALMMGGLRPGTTNPLTAAARDEILHHWHDVNKLTGQAFNFEGALPEGFIYDTEPASRAVITMAALSPEQIFPYFKSIQSAFYLEDQNVTNDDTLAELAQQQGLSADKFYVHFQTDGVKEETQQHFQRTHQSGVSGFPTLVLQRESDFEVITRGYQSFDTLSEQVENWLKKTVQ